MFHLDLRTIGWMALGGHALMSAVMFSLRRSYPKNIPGLGEWALAALIQLLAAGLLDARGVLPDFLSLAVGQALQLTAGLMLYLGVERFYGGVPKSRHLFGLLLVWSLLLCWFVAIQPHYGARVVLTGLFNAGLALGVMALMLRHGHQSFPARLIAAVLAWTVLVILFYMAAAWSRPLAPSPFEFMPAQTLHVVTQAFVWPTVMVGLVLLASSRLHSELQYLGTHDPLTHVLMRRSMIEACERELDRCRRHHRDMALLLLDLDHFKNINDTRGHAVGDEVILDFVARVNGILRRPDQLGRYDGATFAVLLPETGPQEALAVAERIRSRTSVLHPSLPSYTVSIGATANLPAEDQIDTLVKRAEKALQQAKATGRNRVAFV